MVWVQHSHQQKFLPEPKWRTGQTVHFHFLSSENSGGFINQFLKAARTIGHNPSPATYFETLFSKLEILILLTIIFSNSGWCI